MSFEESHALKEDLETLLDGYEKLHDSTIRIKAKYETPDLNFADTLRWQALLTLSSEADVITPGLLSKGAYDYALPILEEMSKQSSVILPMKKAILEKYSADILEKVDGRDIYAKLNGQFKSSISRMFSGDYKNLIAGLQLYASDGIKIKYDEAVELADNLVKYQSALETFTAKESTVQGAIGPCYSGIDTDWERVLSVLNKLHPYFTDGDQPFGNLANMTAQDYQKDKDEFLKDAAELKTEVDAIEEAKQRVSDLFSTSTLDLDNDGYDKCIGKIKGCLDEFDKLGNWINFLGLITQLKEEDLLKFVQYVIVREVAPEDITGAYRRIYYKHWIENILFTVPEPASFTRIKQDQTVQEFVEKDKDQYEISKAQIKSELSLKRPSLDLIAGGSAVATLRREGQKKKKQMPIRKLLYEIGSLVQVLKPCFLMSPLSVSTFLDPEKITFDTVVFDEASQIFPQDAIGAIYRGKQIIVVGDSRQMPPTNFFNASLDIEDEDEEVGDISDFESILDICSTVFSTERLAWHYRSHYEQLIAFSNMNIYNNRLVTFPSASTDHKGIGVDYYYVDGTFDRKSKTNRAEAEYIVDLIYWNIENYPDRTLGVVAFSVAQQNLIDKLLAKKREADRSHEEFFNCSCSPNVNSYIELDDNMFTGNSII